MYRVSCVDAGVRSTVAQYGVSLAVGAAGGVLLLGNCAAPPAESLAQHVYASEDWAAASGQPTGNECSSAHVLLTRERAWVSRPIPIAWSTVEAPAEPRSAPPAPAAPASPAAPAPPTAPATLPDAGSSPRRADPVAP